MKHVSTLVAIIFCSVLVLQPTQPLFGQALDPAVKYAVTNGAQGKEFWLAIPPNELLPFPVDNLEIYVTSAYDTEITVFESATGMTYKRLISAGEITTLSDANGTVSWQSEIREYENPLDLGIRITAEDPITVSVLNNKAVTADGYLALPTTNWDKSYVVTTYYDFKEAKQWGGGFCVVAGEDETTVKITLRGRGDGSARTSGGKKIGDSWQVILQQGQVYCVVGDGTTRGTFDLTGTLVESNRPVGLLSFHQRTTMPNLLVNGNGRNHLVEMNIPVAQWDTSYATIQFRRTGTVDLGDVMRIVASEDNTSWSMVSYDLSTHQVLDSSGGMLQEGEFAEIDQATEPKALVRGVSIWKSSKPVQVIQYSCSSNFDGDNVHDPFQINLVPALRYVHATAFQIPTSTEFTSNFLNLVFIADPNDSATAESLKKVTIDGEPLWSRTGVEPNNLLASNITGTVVWAVRLHIARGEESHTVVSPDIPFGGYVYGFGQVDAYGWPLGPLHKNVVGQDTSSPDIDTVGTSGSSWRVEVTEVVNNPGMVDERPARNDQVDAGIASVNFMPGSTNLELRTIVKPGDSRESAVEGVYEVHVVNTENDASGTIYALDYAGNVSYQTFRYAAILFPTLQVAEAHDLGTITTGDLVCGTPPLILRNSGKADLVVESVQLQNGNKFSIDQSILGSLPITIAPSETYSLQSICFEAENEGTYQDVLEIETNDTIGIHSVGLTARARQSVSVNDNDVIGGLKIQRSGQRVLLAWSQERPLKWEIYDVLGRLIDQAEISNEATNESINLDELSAGAFILVVKTREHSQAVTLVN